MTAILFCGAGQWPLAARPMAPRRPTGSGPACRSTTSMRRHARRAARRRRASRRCARDIFTSDDFYVDRDLWRDPRYFRCNSPLALDSQWGDYSSGPEIYQGRSRDGRLGSLRRRLRPRAHRAVPMPFTTAQAHYEALLAEARAKGGPTQYSREHMPPNWDGRYTDQRQHRVRAEVCGERNRKCRRNSASRRRGSSAFYNQIADHPLPADAGVSAAARSAALSPGARSRAAMAG